MSSNSTTLVLRAIDYIEANLNEPIILNDVANHLYLSTNHLQNIFIEHTGIPVGHYIKKRRLTEAAKQLIISTKPILHIALEYGYNSQEAFTRAFKKLFQITPLKYRNNAEDRYYCYYEALSKQKLLALKNYSIQKVPVIKEIESFTLTGTPHTFNIRNYNNHLRWEKICEFHRSLPLTANSTVFIYYTYDKDLSIQQTIAGSEFTFFIGTIADPKSVVPPTGHSIIIPTRKYATFTYKGPCANLPDAYTYIMIEWLSHTPYSAKDCFSFEFFKTIDEASNIVEVYILIPIH